MPDPKRAVYSSPARVGPVTFNETKGSAIVPLRESPLLVLQSTCATSGRSVTSLTIAALIARCVRAVICLLFSITTLNDDSHIYLVIYPPLKSHPAWFGDACRIRRSWLLPNHVSSTLEEEMRVEQMMLMRGMIYGLDLDEEGF